MTGGFATLQVTVIVAAVAWIFWPALHGDWLWDDSTDITRNPITQSPSGLWAIWFQPGSQLDYYPVKASIQWLQWQLWGNDTLGYHLTNVVLHVINALLFWKLLARLEVRYAWLGGLLFAVHPALVDSVAWIVELKNTLSTAPFLWAMICWVGYDKRGSVRDYFLAISLFLVAMLTKPAMVMWPFVILLYAWWKRRRIGWPDIRASLPFFGLSLGVGLVTLLIGGWYEQKYHSIIDQPIIGGVEEHLALAGTSITFYTWRALWPIGLLPIYAQWSVSPPSWIQFVPWVVMALLFFGAWRARTGWGRHSILGGGFFFLMLLPFLGFYGINYMTFTWVMDHFLYVPILGLIGLFVAGLEAVKGRLDSTVRPYGVSAVAAMVVALIWQAHDYAEKFVNQETLWTYTLASNPEAWPAHNNLGNAMVAAGHDAEAIHHFQEVIRMRPNFPRVYNNIGNALLHLGRMEEAIDNFQHALRLDPRYDTAEYDLGVALMQKGDLPAAIGHFKTASELNPFLASAHTNWGVALAKLGRIDEAVAQFRAALEIDPKNQSAINNLQALMAPH